MVEEPQGEARTIGSLIMRVQVAQRNLGPHNPYRLLLVECVAAIQSLANQLLAAKQAEARGTFLVKRMPDEGEVPV